MRANFRGLELRHTLADRFIRLVWAGRRVHATSGVAGETHDCSTRKLAFLAEASQVFNTEWKSHVGGSNHYELSYISPAIHASRRALHHPDATLDTYWANDATMWLTDGTPVARRSWMLITGLLHRVAFDPGAKATLAYLQAAPHHIDAANDIVIGQTGRISNEASWYKRNGPYDLRGLLGFTGSATVLCDIVPCMIASHEGSCLECDTRLAELIAFQLRDQDPRALSTADLARVGDTARRLVHL